MTKIGFLFLERMGCFNVSTEVSILSTLKKNHKTDKHHIIDVLGLQWQYFPPTYPHKGVNKKLILRGIEVKVSKNDYNNGFIQSGCHYHYLIIPKGLIEENKVPFGVGVIEVDLQNFKVKVYKNRINSYSLIGVQIIQKPKRNIVDDVTIKYCKSQISETLTNQTKRWLVEELKESKEWT